MQTLQASARWQVLPCKIMACLFALGWLMLSAGAALCVEPYDWRYHRSADGDTEAVVVLDGWAVFQERLPTAEGGHRLEYYLCEAVAADEPETARGIDLQQRQAVAGGIREGCWVECPTGKKLLLTGSESKGVFETPADVCWLIGADQKTAKARTLEELAVAAPELQPLLGRIKLLPIGDLFEQLKKETLKPAPAPKR